ncbi:MAG: DNA-directed RNA polymerase subunit alpha C-terminal domain-containing protein [Phycisphaerae bacterium]
MDQVEQDVDTIEQIVEKDSWSAEEHDALMAQLLDVSDPAGRLSAILRKLENENPEPKGAAALKIGILRYMLCRFSAALDALSEATDNKDRHWFQAMCLKHLQQYAQASEEFERAESRGWDGGQVALQQAELLVLRGELDEASKALKKVAASLGDSPDFLYVKGMMLELAGDGEEAVSLYIQARELADGHDGATFRLAYFYDLHGEEEEAIELYREIISHPPIFANALLNLAVLYEDAGQYNQATEAVRRVLAINPNHGRAKMFLKDAEASKNMYYDEDQARRIAKRNAVLDIPVTDFELSVRARNCLKKMNIRTLGDLVKITESELLGYKNFGETSLKEIKDMLSAKGLRLGQALEEGSELAIPTTLPESPQIAGVDESVLNKSVDHVEFSVRSRRALETLGINTLGDLAAKTEAELLACKNFGQTSLNEMRQRLTENGLDLRDPNA